MTAGTKCLLCGQPAVNDHHPTGARWDPETMVPLCHNHHMLVHDDWHTGGVGPDLVPVTTLHARAMLMKRWAMLLGRAAAEGLLPVLLVPLAAWLAKHASAQLADCAALDREVPGWQAVLAIAE
jgi:hypothetical protein